MGRLWLCLGYCTAWLESGNLSAVAHKGQSAESGEMHQWHVWLGGWAVGQARVGRLVSGWVDAGRDGRYRKDGRCWMREGRPVKGGPQMGMRRRDRDAAAKAAVTGGLVSGLSKKGVKLLDNVTQLLLSATAAGAAHHGQQCCLLHGAGCAGDTHHAKACLPGNDRWPSARSRTSSSLHLRLVAPSIKMAAGQPLLG